MSPDLYTLTFNGRKLLLAGDGRVRNSPGGGELSGGSLVYADTTKPGAKVPKRNNIVVILYLRGDGTVSGMAVNNIILLNAKYRIFVPAQTVGGFNVPAINIVANAFSFAFHTYSDAMDPIKVP